MLIRLLIILSMLTLSACGDPNYQPEQPPTKTMVFYVYSGGQNSEKIQFEK